MVSFKLNSSSPTARKLKTSSSELKNSNSNSNFHKIESIKQNKAEDNLIMSESTSAQLQAHNSSLISKFLDEHQGNCLIQRVLLASNGIAAVKEMRSVRKWAYETFENDRVIEFVAMATPDDFKANAEYIKMADRVVEVNGGSNNNNFANVDLIVQLAQENKVQVTKFEIQYNIIFIRLYGQVGVMLQKIQNYLKSYLNAHHL